MNHIPITTVLRRELHAAVDHIEPAVGLTRIRNETGTPGRTEVPASPTTVKGSKAMTSIPKSARHLRKDEVIVRHPFHPDRQVEWAVTANLGVGGDGMVRIEHDDPDGSAGLLVVEATAKVQVKVTVGERQKQQMAVVASLIDRGLPPVKWHIEPHEFNEDLRAQVCAGGGDEASMRVLAAWAEFFGTGVVSTTHERYIDVRVTGVHDGVRIRIYDHHQVTYAYMQVAKKGPATS